MQVLKTSCMRNINIGVAFLTFERRFDDQLGSNEAPLKNQMQWIYNSKAHHLHENLFCRLI